MASSNYGTNPKARKQPKDLEGIRKELENCYKLDLSNKTPSGCVMLVEQTRGRLAYLERKGKDVYDRSTIKELKTQYKEFYRKAEEVIKKQGEKKALESLKNLKIS